MIDRRIRAAIFALIGLALLAGVVAALTGLFLLLALVVGLAVLNLVYLPRAASYLHVSVGWIALMLIAPLCLAGAMVGGPEGAAWGLGLWLVAIGLPRAIGWDLIRRVRRRLRARAHVAYYDVPVRTISDEGGNERESRRPTLDPGGRPWRRGDGPGLV